YYIGKPSFNQPKVGHGRRFWFATYGGGVCFSQRLLSIIKEHVDTRERFIKGCIDTKYPDDTYIAYLLHAEYNINLTIAENFHHHIEKDLYVNLTSTIDQAITLGFKGSNVPRFSPIVNRDIFHMQTTHCLLYPNNLCMKYLRTYLNRLYEREESKTSTKIISSTINLKKKKAT
ncbi:unnamed protein product, partial [Didymodactylos carnosus]